MSSALDQLLPELQPWASYLLQWGEYYWPGQLTVTSVYRSPTKQAELWANRASNPFPVARPGTSYHEYRRAFDLVGPAAALAWLGRLWESWGGTWGGGFQHADPIHFQA